MRRRSLPGETAGEGPTRNTYASRVAAITSGCEGVDGVTHPKERRRHLRRGDYPRGAGAKEGDAHEGVEEKCEGQKNATPRSSQQQPRSSQEPADQTPHPTPRPTAPRSICSYLPASALLQQLRAPSSRSVATSPRIVATTSSRPLSRPTRLSHASSATSHPVDCGAEVSPDGQSRSVFPVHHRF